MKLCFKCNRQKDINEFYVHKQMADGHLGKCKSCTKKDVRDRYNDPEAKKRITQYEKVRFQDPRRKANVSRYQKKRREKHRGKDRARSKFSHAVRTGKITRKPCEICKNPKSQGHHTDYRKPLQVKWLCFKHHREAHSQQVTSNHV